MDFIGVIKVNTRSLDFRAKMRGRFWARIQALAVFTPPKQPAPTS